ncbi:TetR/AcrR family transcriptional regulator [Thalassospira sp. HF15]|uniref:TetR/AcrR family transcriptional regulator n=1 Tax=Thalassospira sp. HF15 TaxID=2722755 RepID=UPI001430D1D2|nr:TetR/AcrR family transcriptional regulator [Thalassospira sp. HF15]NIY75242.1 TetR/AcrR family transcriptional regulator [Thalassospira sp. HF15]
MPPITKAQRKQNIEKAAYEILHEKGYVGASMLAIAKRARASNETMYRWYGDKRGLFAELVRENARAVTDMLRDLSQPDHAAADIIKAVGPRLLELLVSERAVMLNRAAASDTSGMLGEVIGECGRDTVMPMIVDVFDRGVAQGWLKEGDAQNVAETYLSLLVGDWQVRRVIGTLSDLSNADITTRADCAYDQLCQLFAEHNP